MAKAKKKVSAVERDLIDGLTEYLGVLKSGKAVAAHFTSHRVALDLKLTTFTPAKVKRTRELLHVSQGLFAQFLGVSIKTVRSWEQGRQPSDMARRFLQEIEQDPDYWRARLMKSMRPKSTV